VEDEASSKKARIANSAQLWLDSEPAATEEFEEEPMAEAAEAELEAVEEEEPQPWLLTGGPPGDEHEYPGWPSTWEWTPEEGGGVLNLFYQEAIHIDYQEQEARGCSQSAEEPLGLQYVFQHVLAMCHGLLVVYLTWVMCM
jgi:hypothetical protein